MLPIAEGKDYKDVDEALLPYELVRNLGHGHSGNVEEVRDKTTSQLYARKTMRIPFSSRLKAECSAMFHNEVKIIRGLRTHRHIISVHATYVTKCEFGIILASEGDLESFLVEYWVSVRKIWVRITPWNLAFFRC